MSYIQDNLQPNEKVILSARVHPAVFLAPIVAFIAGVICLVNMLTRVNPTPGTGDTTGLIWLIGSVFFFLYAIKLVIQATVIILTTEFAITNRRVIAKSGFIRRHTVEILLSKIESVTLNQNILGRLLNFGNVTVTGTGGTRETFKVIAGPVAVRSKINQIIEFYTKSYEENQNRKSVSVS